MSTNILAGLKNGSVNPAKVVEWHSKLLEDRQGATGGNKNEINKQIAAIEQSAEISRMNGPETEGMTNFGNAIINNKRAYERIPGDDPNLDPNRLNEPKA